MVYISDSDSDSFSFSSWVSFLFTSSSFRVWLSVAGRGGGGGGEEEGAGCLNATRSLSGSEVASKTPRASGLFLWMMGVFKGWNRVMIWTR